MENEKTNPLETDSVSPDLVERILIALHLSRIAPLYSGHKAVWRYLFFGAVTTAVDFLVYLVLTALAVDPLVANAAAWAAAVVVAYITNRAFVFTDRANGARGIFLEILRFTLGRVGTLLLSEGGILLFVTLLGMNDIPVKVALSVAVVILNYFLGKFFVFIQKK